MNSLMICQKIYISRKLLNSSLTHKVSQSFSTTVRNLNTIQKEPILKNNCFSLLPKRKFFQLFRKPTKNELKIKDDVPDQYKLIYLSTMDKYILYTQIVTTGTVLITAVSAMVKYDFSNLEIDYSGFKSPPRAVENEIFVYLSAFVCIVVTLQVLVSRLPARIYNLPQQKKYIFVFHGNYPFTQRKVICKVGDVIPLQEKGILPWRDSRYLIKDQQKVILLEKYFRRSADLYIMLGVQRDPDVDE